MERTILMILEKDNESMRTEIKHKLDKFKDYEIEGIYSSIKHDYTYEAMIHLKRNKNVFIKREVIIFMANNDFELMIAADKELEKYKKYQVESKCISRVSGDNSLHCIICLKNVGS